MQSLSPGVNHCQEAIMIDADAEVTLHIVDMWWDQRSVRPTANHIIFRTCLASMIHLSLLAFTSDCASHVIDSVFKTTAAAVAARQHVELLFLQVHRRGGC